jgi:hypothetical protein
MAFGMLNSSITNGLADPEFPVETGLADAAEFTQNALCVPCPEWEDRPSSETKRI